MANPNLHDLTQRWLREDQDKATNEEIAELSRDNNVTELTLRLGTRIAFGTAGLRAAMKAGYAYMNSLTVLQASHGLAQYILDTRSTTSPNPEPGVAIGYDARHHSEKFARLTATAFLSKGFKVFWFGRLVHTPMVPFAVKHYCADAGVMITASHNPKNDNGYKVYWNNGSQIIPPHDAGIAAAIEQVSYIDTWDSSDLESKDRVISVYREAGEAYFQSIRKLASRGSGHDNLPSFMYTPLHGVGLQFMTQTLEAIPGAAQAFHVVEAQAQPDPEFPTVPFPNPEEQGALDLAKQEAEKQSISLVLANDPDADRFSAAEIVDGEWQQLTGNQIGVLFASYLLEAHGGDKKKIAMLASTVSSRMLPAMARKEEFHFQETLTGFKWLGNVAQDLQRNGYDACYAYEEAIGFMFPTVVWDKDGIAAATVFLRACSFWHESGLTPWSKLQQLYEKYGYFADANTYLISPSPETTNRVFQDIRGLNAGARPDKVGDRTIRRWRDLTTGFDSGTFDHKPELPIDSSAQMITCYLDDVIFTARGSGTEPKIKLYIEGQAASSVEAQTKANEVLQDLLAEWFKTEYGLKLAGS